VLPLHEGVPDVDYDVDVELMELAYAFRTTLETIPANVPYLRAPGAAHGHASAAASGTHGGPFTRSRDGAVGIAWRAGDWNPRRSIDFERLIPLFDDTGLDVRWHSLQFDWRRDEQHPRLHAFTGDTGLRATAARIATMSLVISIDSMPAHLAGALGVPVWTLLPHEADWRWLERRSDSPWYPTMRLFRQSRPYEWSGVLACVHQALAAEFNQENTHVHFPAF
jgi:hypothetical protein